MIDIDKIEALAKGGGDQTSIIVNTPDMRDLLARLRAAEAVCESASKHRMAATNEGIPWADYFAHTDNLDRDLDAWLKTKDQP
jgi:guanylate kinase